MKLFSILPTIPLLLAGCVAPNAVQTITPPLPAPAAAPALPTKIVEIRYEVRGYQDPANRSLRHEPHAIYRQTRVPAPLNESTGASRATFPPVSITPLPQSDELTAELASQRKLTAELFAMQAALTEAEQKMKTQFAALVRQSEETLKLREQLETERNRLRFAATSVPSPAPAGATPSHTEAKW